MNYYNYLGINTAGCTCSQVENGSCFAVELGFRPSRLYPNHTSTPN